MAKKMGIGVVAALAVLLVAGLAMAQPGGGPGGPGGGGGGMMGGGGFDPAQMQQMMDQRNMETLGVTEAQWKTIGPKFTAVQTATRSLNSGGMGMGRGMGGMGGGRGMGMMGGQPTELDKARETLNTTLDDAAATPDKIQAAVKAFRTAKEAAKKDLTAKQAELKTAIGNNAKMEGRLIAMGMLD